MQFCEIFVGYFKFGELRWFTWNNFGWDFLVCGNKNKIKKKLAELAVVTLQSLWDDDDWNYFLWKRKLEIEEWMREEEIIALRGTMKYEAFLSKKKKQKMIARFGVWNAFLGGTRYRVSCGNSVITKKNYIYRLWQDNFRDNVVITF